MEWLLQGAGHEMSILHWYIALPWAVNRIVMPVAVFLLFCSYCRVTVKWLWCGVYVVLSAGLFAAEYALGLKGSGGLVVEILLLAGCGRIMSGRAGVRILAAAVLILSVLSVTNGIVSWADQRIATPVILANKSLIRSSDGIREFFKVAAVLALFGIVVKRFGRIMDQGDLRTLIWVTIPVFFISMVERIIQNSIYGDSLVFDSISGKVCGIVDINHGEMLFLQVFAGFCLFLTLFAYEKITGIFREAENLKILREQSRAQENYIREADARNRQTRAFRHDIRNHLTVLKKLLEDGKTQEAQKFLSQLEETVEGLSCSISTGNAAADALLGSKLFLAGQEGIRAKWEIRIPQDSSITDLDWCIILSNGIDNGIAGCCETDEKRRYFKIEGKKQGDFYLISMENSCRGDRKTVPEDGTGLSNIRAVAEKYQGRVENEISDGVYKLRVLLVDSRQEKGI